MDSLVRLHLNYGRKPARYRAVVLTSHQTDPTPKSNAGAGSQGRR